ncbi:YgiW/YdeI family stress tolerance OB fold protein [Ursidibacter arcticus]
MKKAIIFTTLLTVSTITMAKGGFHDGHHKEKMPMQQGFFDENVAVKSVADAIKAVDDTSAVLVGSIVKQIDKNEFIFKDSTGEIQIDVSKRAWNGQTITPQDTIEIRGKVDKDWTQAEIDVKQIIKK